MSTSVETQGLSIEEAIQLGLNALGTSRDRVDVEVVHHPRGGFLGLGARRAKVRVTLRVDPVQDGQEFDMSVRDRAPRRRRRRAGGRGQQRGTPRPDREDQKKPREGERTSRGERAQKGEPRRDRQQGDRQRQRGAKSGQGERRRGGPRQQGQARQAPQQASQQDTADTSQQAAPRQPQSQSVQASEPERPATPRASVSEPPQDLALRAAGLTGELMSRMGFEARVNTSSDTDGKHVVVDLEVEAEGLLIGRRGQTLDALEHILNRMLYAGGTAGEGAVVLDVGGYRQRRSGSLEEMTTRLRDRAIAESRAIQVSPMSPRDRQTVQNLLSGDPQVEVRVLGSGVYRRLQIVPAGVDPDADRNDQVEVVDEQPPADETVEPNEDPTPETSGG